MNESQQIEIAEKLHLNIDETYLSPSQKRTLLSLCGHYRHVFATNTEGLGKTNLYEFEIDTGDATPQRRNYYRYPPHMRQEIDRQVSDILSNGIIEPSVSRWLSPVCLVKKKTGEWRLAIDYRPLNAVTKTISWPILRLDDIFDAIASSEAKYFSVCDLSSGFWQVPMSESSKETTAFITHNGVYQFRRMLFGTVNSPMAFSMVMSRALGDINWRHVLIYIDDIFIMSSDFDEHIKHMEEVFVRLNNAGLRLKPSKCCLAQTRVTFLGYEVTEKGIAVDEAKTEAIRSYPRPKNMKDIRAFLGTCSYYRRHINGFAHIAAPVRRSAEKG
jgi:hypothetical protein